MPSALGKGLRKYVFDLLELPIILRYVQDNSFAYLLHIGWNKCEETYSCSSNLASLLNRKALDGHEEYPWVVVVHEASKEGTKYELVPFVVNRAKVWEI